MGQVGLVLDDLEKVQGRLVSVQDGLDSSTPNARHVIAMLWELARAESANIGLRVRSAKEHLRSSGRWIGGQAPYGLFAREGRLYVDPETGPIVSGYTGTVRPWRDSETGETVSVMAEGQEPLVSPADQARIVALFAERTRMSALGRSTVAPQGESRHLLTGLLRCAGCGNRMSRQGRSYRCQTARLGRTCEAPGGAYQETLDQEVTAAWVGRLATAEPGDPLLDAVADRWTAQHDPEAVAKRASVLAALDQERAAIAALDEDHYVRRSLDRERYLSLAEALSRRIEGLERTLAANPVPDADISALLDPSPEFVAEDLDGVA